MRCVLPFSWSRTFLARWALSRYQSFLARVRLRILHRLPTAAASEHGKEEEDGDNDALLLDVVLDSCWTTALEKAPASILGEKKKEGCPCHPHVGLERLPPTHREHSGHLDAQHMPHTSQRT